MKIAFTISIVLFHTPPSELKKTVMSVLSCRHKFILFLIDNSPLDDLRLFEEFDKRIIYIHNPSNPGFGVAHNIAIQKAIELNSKYHFIVNPDIYFNGDIITTMIDYMSRDASIGMMMPQILNLDGTVQNLPKLLPNPFSILWRKLRKPKKAYEKFINEYELRLVPTNIIYSAPILSGCFTLLNMNAVKKVGFYDDAFFMYFEDWDLSRRMHQHYKTIYFPLVSVFHGYESGANKSRILFKIFVNSAITYFNKWGWFFDADRNKINREALSQFK